MIAPTIDRRAAESLMRQLYGAIRDQILAGRMRPGERLPSTRELARDLGVSRNTVIDAFEQLQAEGYVEARRGSGTAVAPGATFRRRSARGVRALPPAGSGPYRTDIVDFRSGLPDLTRFPVRTWQRLSREIWDRVRPLDLSYGSPEGRPELREAIADYVVFHRGVRCHPEQVVVTAGTTQAVGIVGRLLLGAADSTSVLEDPLTSDIRRILAATGARAIPVSVDGQGLVVDELPLRVRPALIYVTPSHQYPLGVTMPIQRRVGLLEYARRTGAYVVEDDYDSEFRYESPPISSIQGLDPERVVYVGTFSKTLGPALRIGYLILPPALVQRGRQVKWFSDLHNASVDQLVLARFIAEGSYSRHVRAMKRIYRERRELLVDGLHRRLGGAAEVLGSAAGLHLCARFSGVRFGAELLRGLEQGGVRVYPVEEHAALTGRYVDTVIMGYGMLDAERIEKGVRLLANRLRTAPAPRAPRSVPPAGGSSGRAIATPRAAAPGALPCLREAGAR